LIMAFVVTVIIKHSLLLVAFLAATVAARIGYVQTGAGHPAISIPESLSWALSNKFVLGFLFVAGLITLRKLLMKLQDVDVDTAR